MPITELNPNTEGLTATERAETIRRLLAQLVQQAPDHGSIRILTRIKGLEPELYLNPYSSNPNPQPFAIITGENIALFPDDNYTYDVYYRRGPDAELFLVPYEEIELVTIAKPYEY